MFAACWRCGARRKPGAAGKRGCGVRSDRGQTDVEIVACRVRIWADDVGLGDQIRGGGGIEAWQADRERDVEAKALPVVTWADPHRRGDGALVGDLRLALTRDIFDGA